MLERWPDDTDYEPWSGYLPRVKLPNVKKGYANLEDAVDELFTPDFGWDIMDVAKSRDDGWGDAMCSLDSACPDASW